MDADRVRSIRLRSMDRAQPCNPRLRCRQLCRVALGSRSPPSVRAFLQHLRIQGRASAVLLFVLAFTVAAIAVLTLSLRIQPQPSRVGIAITIAALIAMPILAKLKRREARRSNNVALAADAVQSATCAYLALIALTGLSCNEAFHIPWIDSVAALAAVPILIKEGRTAWRGQTCGCC